MQEFPNPFCPMIIIALIFLALKMFATPTFNIPNPKVGDYFKSF